MIKKLRAPRPILALGCAALFAGGCISTSGLRPDVLAARQDRFAAWRTEKGGEETARPNVSGALSLDECIRIALRNSRQIQLAVLEKVKAGARITEAWSEALPSLELDAGYTRLDQVPVLKVPASNGKTQSVSLGSVDNYSVSATLKQPLYRGGEVSAGVRGANIYSVLVDEQMRGTVQGAIFAARKAYYDARLAMELEAASRRAVAVAERTLQDAKTSERSGALSPFDVLRAEVEVKTLTAQNVQDQNRYHLALTTLLNVIGVSQESRIELSQPLTYRPISPKMEDAVQAAFLQNSDILQGEYTIRLQREAVNVARAGYFPKLDAFVTDTEARPDPHNSLSTLWGNAWSAGLSLTYKVFDGFKTASQVKQARVQLQQNEVSLRDTEERILLQIKQALFSLEDAAKAVAAQEASVKEAEEALRLAELSFREGVRKQVEVLDAQRALTSAEATYANAVYDHEVAQLQLEQATGALEPPPEVSPGAPVPAGKQAAPEGR